MRLVNLCLLLSLLAPGCGGSTVGTEPKSASAEDEPDSSEPRADAASDTDADSEPEESAPPASAASCNDGTCSPCGSGICLAGWYCDEGASGGPACSWLKECAEKPSCSCVTRVLGSACQCREEAGGLKVSCG